MPSITAKKPKKLKSFESKIVSRHFAYKLLSRVFLEVPNKEFIGLMNSEGFLDSMPYAKSNEIMKNGIEKVKGYLADSSDDAVKAASEDYTYLFIGPNKLPSPPWESVYRDETKLLFAEQTMQVRAFYRSCGFIPQNLDREPDDHIAFELDFIFKLNDRILELFKQGEVREIKGLLMSQKKFLNDHISKWVHEFSKDVVKSARTEFYKGFAKVLSGFIKEDKKNINVLITDLSSKSA